MLADKPQQKSVQRRLLAAPLVFTAVVLGFVWIQQNLVPNEVMFRWPYSIGFAVLLFLLSSFWVRWYAGCSNEEGENALLLTNSFFDRSSDGIIVQKMHRTYDGDRDAEWQCGPFEKVNAGFASLVKRSPEELQGASLREIWPQTALSLSRICAKSMEEEGPLAIEQWVPEMEKTLRFQLIPLGEERLTIVCSDISDQKIELANARADAERYRSIFENLPDGVFVVGPTGTIFDCNERAATMNGYTRGELVGQSISLLNSPHQGNEIVYDSEGYSFPADQYFAYLQKHDTLQFRSLHRHKGGQSKTFEVAASLVTIDGQEYSLGLDRPVAEKDDLVVRLRESQERLQSMTRNLRDVIFETTSDGRYTYVSPSHENVLGRGQEVLGHLHTECVPYEDKAVVMRAWRKAAATTEESRAEYRYVHPDKGILWLESVATSYLDQHDQVVVLVTARDITQRKQTEEALFKQAERQELAAQLAYEFLNESLNQVDEKISASLELIGRTLGGDRCFITQLAHDGLSAATTHEWMADDVEYSDARTINFDVDELSWLYRQIFDRKVVALSSLDEMPPEAWSERRRLQKRGVKSLVCVPTMTGGEVTGTLNVFALKGPRLITDDDVHMLQIAAGVMASALQRARAERKLTHLTFHDQVTGLYNRTFFEEEIRRLDTERQLPLSMIMADVNGLKMVNDALGHHEGDRLLRRVAAILRRSCRQEDIVARWGGDEFVILLPETNYEDAQMIAHRIRVSCAEAEEQPIRPSVALGCATKSLADDDLQMVLKEAEDRMYTNKMSSAQSSRSTTIASLQRTLEEKSHETREHAQKLQTLSLRLGESLGVGSGLLEELGLFALLHDLGKVAIPETILDKPGPLTPDEWEIMQRHPEIGYRIAKTSPELAVVADLILSHHERWDGQGYPRRLKGDEIPLLARIVSVVDAYDAMTTDRSYRRGMAHEEALAEIESGAGTQFDPRVAAAFIEIARDPEFWSTESEPIQTALSEHNSNRNR